METEWSKSLGWRRRSKTEVESLVLGIGLGTLLGLGVKQIKKNFRCSRKFVHPRMDTYYLFVRKGPK